MDGGSGEPVDKGPEEAEPNVEKSEDKSADSEGKSKESDVQSTQPESQTTDTTEAQTTATPNGEQSSSRNVTEEIEKAVELSDNQDKGNVGTEKSEDQSTNVDDKDDSVVKAPEKSSDEGTEPDSSAQEKVPEKIATEDTACDPEKASEREEKTTEAKSSEDIPAEEIMETDSSDPPKTSEEISTEVERSEPDDGNENPSNLSTEETSSELPDHESPSKDLNLVLSGDDDSTGHSDSVAEEQTPKETTAVNQEIELAEANTEDPKLPEDKPDESTEVEGEKGGDNKEAGEGMDVEEGKDDELSRDPFGSEAGDDKDKSEERDVEKSKGDESMEVTEEEGKETEGKESDQSEEKKAEGKKTAEDKDESKEDADNRKETEGEAMEVTEEESKDKKGSPEKESSKGTDEPVIQISNIASGVVEDIAATEDDQSSGIQIASVTSEETGIQIASVRSEEPEKDSGIKIASVVSQENEKSNPEVADKSSSDTEKSTEDIQIASVNSGDKDPETVEILDDDNETTANKDKESSKESTDASDTQNAKKPVLKLASFAGLGENGIADVRSLNSDKSGCHQCKKQIETILKAVVWETMQFCNEECLDEYQQTMNSCSTCKKFVQTTSLGKYCVRFGADIKQFCSNSCLEDYKKGLKVCCYCQKDISNGDGFLAPIGDKGQFKDFCEQDCLKKYSVLHLGQHPEKETLKCAVCSDEKPVEKELICKEKVIKLCSDPCFNAYKFGNNVESAKCDQCSKDFDHKEIKNTIYYDGLSKIFCSKACQNVYIMQKRRIVPCQWCKVKKYNFDMIEKFSSETTSLLFCSLNCLRQQSKQSITPTSKAVVTTSAASWNGRSNMPVIQSVSSLAGAGELPVNADRLPTEPVPPSQLGGPMPPPQVIKEHTKETIIKMAPDPERRNKGCLTKPFMQTKGVSCRPHPCHKSTQTEGAVTPALVPVATPMWMPTPVQMYNAPFPVPIPVPLPIPVPIFIPTTRNSAKGIMKQIKKIREKLPADPFEAELLAMAGALVEKKDEPDSDDSVANDNVPGDSLDDYDDDDEPAMRRSAQHTEDLENEIAADKVIPKALPVVTPDPAPSPGPMTRHGRTTPRGYGGQKRRYSGANYMDDDEEDWDPSQEQFIQRRSQPQRRSRGRKSARLDPAAALISQREQSAAVASIVPQPPKERPDAKHHLKFTYGVNAWKHWVVQKNAELEKARAQGKYMKTFETDILKLRADELNYTLCMFVKEVKKPNGEAYAPDSVFYLALGIQEYLFENGRIDNIFTDQYYEPFTSALHEVVKDFKLPVNELGYFVTRIEEEHLWEAKQLGAHSPQVLLNTLIYFNTKYFMLKTQDEHSKLSFSHIMKHWKKTQVPNKPGQQQRTVLLRYYPPPVKGQRNEDRRCYEQHENHDNPLRCPVKLYEFYLSKCPESTKTRNDLFYLQPERSCVPDSPVWYSNQQLNGFQLDKMLQRLLMVREVQEHMLADAQS